MMKRHDPYLYASNAEIHVRSANNVSFNHSLAWSYQFHLWDSIIEMHFDT